MIPIIICEDDLHQLESIQEYINNFILIEDIPMQIALASSDPQEVLNYAKTHASKYTLYFLDIEFEGEEAGLSLARQIREYDDHSKIIFTTAYPDYLPLTYKYHIEAFGYIVKTSPAAVQEQIVTALQTAHERTLMNHDQRDLFVIHQKNRTRAFKLDEILYFMTAVTPHKLVLVTKHGLFEFYDSLNQVEAANLHFIRSHKSYVVNAQQIISVNRAEMTLTLSNNTTVPVSRQCLNDILSTLNAS